MTGKYRIAVVFAFWVGFFFTSVTQCYQITDSRRMEGLIIIAEDPTIPPFHFIHVVFPSSQLFTQRSSRNIRHAEVWSRYNFNIWTNGFILVLSSRICQQRVIVSDSWDGLGSGSRSSTRSAHAIRLSFTFSSSPSVVQKVAGVLDEAVR